MSKNIKVDDLFGDQGQKPTSSGSTKSRSGTKKQRGGPKNSSPRTEQSMAPSKTTRVGKSDKQSTALAASDESWLQSLEPTLEEPMHMSLTEAQEKVEELGRIPYLSQTKLQRIEFNTAMRVLREDREARHRAKQSKSFVTEFVPPEDSPGPQQKSGRQKESALSPTDKLGAATRIGRPAPNEEKPNRRIDYLYEMEATGRSLAAMMMDEKLTQGDKLSLCSIRNHRLLGIAPHKRTEAQDKEIAQAQHVLAENHAKLFGDKPPQPLPSSAKFFSEKEIERAKKQAIDISELFVNVEALFDDDEPEVSTAKESPVDVVFGPAPDGFIGWLALRLAYDKSTSKKDKEEFASKHGDFNPHPDEAWIVRYRAEQAILDRKAKGADIYSEETFKELVGIFRRFKETLDKGPLDGSGKYADGSEPGRPLPKAASGAGQGEKKPRSIEFAGDEAEVDEVTALIPQKQSDEITEELWGLAQAEALEVETSQAHEIDYSPTYRAMLAEVRYCIKSGAELNIVYEPEALLWRYPRICDMAEQSVPRRAEIVGRIMAYWNKNAYEADGKTPRTGLWPKARHYRVILAAKALGDCIEHYATGWRRKGQNEETDESMVNACKARVKAYLDAHKDVGYPEPSYLQYREIIAKLGQPEGYLLTAEDLAQA
jgi:hypothetical protein